MLYKKVIQELHENKINRLEGRLNCIPWSFKRLSRILPGVQKGRYYIVTASSKV